MKILRIVNDYYPVTGGNETWNQKMDKWFSEKAGDQVDTLVLRTQQLFNIPGYKEILKDYHFEGEFKNPNAPLVKCTQVIWERKYGISLAYNYIKIIRPFTKKNYDIVFTQINDFYSYFSWGKNTVFEPTQLLSCEYGHQTCRRRKITCHSCRKEKGMKWFFKDFLRQILFHKYKVLTTTNAEFYQLKKSVFLNKIFFREHVVIEDFVTQTLDNNQSELINKCLVFTKRFSRNLIQVNRIDKFKNIEYLFEIAEKLPDFGFIIIGDGPEKENLLAKVAENKKLQNNILFTGTINNSIIGHFFKIVDGCLLTSFISNYNTSFVESLYLNNLVFAVHNSEFPEFIENNERIFVHLTKNPTEAAEKIVSHFKDTELINSIKSAAKSHCEKYHSEKKLWEFRDHLLKITQKNNP